MGHFRSLFAERPRTVAYNFIADGDFVAVEARGDNVTKTGLRYDNQYCMVLRIENGKIKEIKEYCNSTLVERVLGPFPAERKLASRRETLISCRRLPVPGEIARCGHARLACCGERAGWRGQPGHGEDAGLDTPPWS